jgi:phage portal protein BeeE
MNQYMAARVQNSSAPPVFDNGAKLVDHPAVSPRDMAMLELAQFTEARIAVLLGVPPFLVGLPSGGSESMTYSNVSQVFDFHDRASLRPKASAVMAALSNWALPGPQKAELNRDEYTRPPFEDRAEAWVKLVAAGIVRVDEARTAERLQGAAPTLASSALTGGE